MNIVQNTEITNISVYILIYTVMFMSVYFVYLIDEANKKMFNKIKNKKIIISIEGNIGSGKSTLINILKKRYKDEIYFVDEPVDEWKNIKMDGKDLIEHFYCDNKKYGYLFQNFAYITKLKNIKKAINNSPYKIIITERSIESDKYLFAKMLYEKNMINKLEWQTYNTWYDFFSFNINYFIYLKTDVDKCVKRIIKRNRKGEENIPKTYLAKLNDKHNEWLDSKKNVLKLNGNQDIFNENIKNHYIYIIDNFLYNINKNY